MIADSLDAIMHVMAKAFDPMFGEAWNRNQVSDALLLPSTHCVIVGAEDGATVRSAEDAAGFALLRQGFGEEELLLLAVCPEHRRKGIGRRLLAEAIEQAKARGSEHLFLEMRDGNPAEYLYRAFGLEQIGRRPGYYRGAAEGPIDAVTFAKNLQ